MSASPTQIPLDTHPDAIKREVSTHFLANDITAYNTLFEKLGKKPPHNDINLTPGDLPGCTMGDDPLVFHGALREAGILDRGPMDAFIQRTAWLLITHYKEDNYTDICRHILQSPYIYAYMCHRMKAVVQDKLTTVTGEKARYSPARIEYCGNQFFIQIAAHLNATETLRRHIQEGVVLHEDINAFVIKHPSERERKFIQAACIGAYDQAEDCFNLTGILALYDINIIQSDIGIFFEESLEVLTDIYDAVAKANNTEYDGAFIGDNMERYDAALHRFCRVLNYFTSNPDEYHSKFGDDGLAAARWLHENAQTVRRGKVYDILTHTPRLIAALGLSAIKPTKPSTMPLLGSKPNIQCKLKTADTPSPR